MPPYSAQLPIEPPPPSQCRVVGPPSKCLLKTVNCLETQDYPEFKFQHMFSMMVVGPSQSGKTHFVQQLLTHKCINYLEKKPLRVYWFYNQWQPSYDDIQRALKKKIQFTQGIPELSDDLHEIRPENNNILVFDDLMSQATDSPVVSKLFTQGRHRNASVILLLQNMFPKGKFNTDISRNALYKVLFRSPGDRKQIDIMAEQTFAKDRPHFMKAYTQETEKPFGYIVLDNHPRTTSQHQVVADVFDQCKSYPYISTRNTVVQSPVTEAEQRKAHPVVKKRKRCNVDESMVKKRKPTKKQKTRKPTKKLKKQLKPQPYTSYQPRETFQEEESTEETDEPFISDEEPSEEERTDDDDNNSEEISQYSYPSYQDRLIKLARPRNQTGYGARCIY